MKLNKEDIKSVGVKAIEVEIEGLKSVSEESIDDTFVELVHQMINCKGRVIVSGMGKPSYIARKFAATLASTGTPAFFMHPSEASHGDLGMITKHDVVILISNSGESKELKDTIRYCKRFNIFLVGISRVAKSTLIEASDLKIVMKQIPETNPVNSPTTSMIMVSAYCDAVITALIYARGFNNEHYKIFHPGGKLGASLKKVSEIMKHDEALPVVNVNATVEEAIKEITDKGIGCVCIIDDNKNAVGIITDGDIRRSITDGMLQKKATEIMNSSPVLIESNMFVAEAIELMNNAGIDHRGINVVFVLDSKLSQDKEHLNIVGALHIQDCLKAGTV